MKTETLSTWISNITLVIVGLIWWLLYYCFGKIDVPMWIYKASLAFFCVYMPLLIIAIVSIIRDNLRQKEDKPTSKKPVLKVYGSSRSE